MEQGVDGGVEEGQVERELVEQLPPPVGAGLQVQRGPEGGVDDGDDPVHPHLPGCRPPAHLPGEPPQLEEGEGEAEDVDDDPEDVGNIMTEGTLQGEIIRLRCTSVPSLVKTEDFLLQQTFSEEKTRQQNIVFHVYRVGWRGRRHIGGTKDWEF